jgi:hypothetical protein
MTVRFLMNDRKEKAMRTFNAGGYKKGGHVTEIAIMMGAPKGMKKSGMGCNKSPVRKSIGGSILDAAFIPGNIKSAFGLKKGGICHGKKVRKADGGPMVPENPEAMQRISDANQMLKNGMGLKKGGTARLGHFKNRMHKADGGSVGLTRMANRDLGAGKSLMGFNKGGDVRMAAGGAGKIRKHVMLKSGKPLSTSFARRHCKDK